LVVTAQVTEIPVGITQTGPRKAQSDEPAATCPNVSCAALASSSAMPRIGQPRRPQRAVKRAGATIIS
jgi:hypothetical protein